MRTNTKSLLIIALLTLTMSFSTTISATENKYETLNATELSNLTIDELLSVDFSELIKISNKIADNTEAQLSKEFIELPIAVLADLDLTNLMAVTDQIIASPENMNDHDTVKLPFTALTAINLKALMTLNESCAYYYKETYISFAINKK